jgi:antitoxin component YwqK of YwqJK toxin-antitoxin module
MKLVILMLLFSSMAFSLTTPEQFVAMNSSDQIDFLYSDEVEENIDSEVIQDTLSDKLKKHINDQANDLLSVWGDTILEGPYALTDEDAVVKIESVFTVAGVVYGAYAYISNSAYFIESDDCDYDYDLEQWSETCEQGEIQESFYVDLNGKIIESDSYADFIY